MPRMRGCANIIDPNVGATKVKERWVGGKDMFRLDMFSPIKVKDPCETSKIHNLS
jgi:hypothetical protein